MNEKLFFKNSKGDKLCGILSDVGDKEKPVMIMTHGHSSSKDSSTYIELEKEFNENGISIFRFDIYGHGESEGKFEDATVSEAADDILNAIEFLKDKGYAKIGLLGASFGGCAAVTAASKTDDLFVLVLRAPVSNYEEHYKHEKTEEEMKEWKEKGYSYYISGDGRKLRKNYSFVKDFKNNDGYKNGPKIKIPTFIIHGEIDKSVPIEHGIKLAKLIPNSKLEFVKGEGHKFKNRPSASKEVAEKIVKFVVENF